MDIQLDIGPQIVNSYKRLGYQAWYALAEFLDNATQNFLDNRTTLNATAPGGSAKLTIEVTTDKVKSLLRVHDTALGMNEADLRQALRIGYPPPNTTGRSEYGLGLKTAACWFGDEWKVTTKKLGDPNEYEVVIKVPEIAKGNLKIPIVQRPKGTDLHYTTIEITKLHRPIHHRTIARLKSYMQSMYRIDVRNGDLEIFFDGALLPSRDAQTGWLNDREGNEYKKTFTTKINNKTVTGWVGVLGPGSAKRLEAGFAVIRRGRVIQGQPTAWRPETIFGEEGRNDLINQRLTGEVHLDGFEISHTKDAILWRDNEEDELEAFLKAEFADFIDKARKPYAKGEGVDEEGPKPIEVQAAVQAVKEQLEKPEIIDFIDLKPIPTPDAVEATKQSIVGELGDRTPDLIIKIGEHECRVYLSTDDSPRDPYFLSDAAQQNVLLVYINCRHPHWNRIRGANGVANYLLECIFDALAEWKCIRQKAPLRPDTIKSLKDELLRLDIQRQDIPESGDDKPPADK